MNAWWNSLQPRERSVIAGGSIVLITFLILWLGLRPLFMHADSARQRVEEKSLLLADLRATAAEMGSRPALGAKMPAADESLVVIVDRSTRETGLAGALKRNQPAGTDQIRVRFENASFNQVMGWLGLLHSNYGIEIESAAFETTEQVGQVQASLTLQRGQP
ncbi:MAG: type II secretion system protein M [Gammaproteobacteria bacterium]|nr:type II secretion system protein M [Gammaproteobacteria bacterium]